MTTAPMTATPPAFAHTLGAELERDRLERRVRRMTLAVDSLRRHATAHGHEPAPPPRHLRQAIADFEAQIEAMSARLRDLAPERASTQIQRWSGADENGH
jgi:hypothetical protein